MMREYRTFLMSIFLTATLGAVAIAWAARHWSLKYREDYLASMRENSEYSCSRGGDPRARLFFIGDSHSYAGWNFNLFPDRLKDEGISGCLMGGFHVETLPIVTARLDAAGYYPSTIVYGISMNQFVERPIKAAQLEQHANLLGALRGRYNLSRAADQLFDYRKWRKQKGAAPYRTQRRNFELHAEAIEAVPEANATRLLEEGETPSKTSWVKFSGNIQFTPGLERPIAEFCRWIERRKISLYVIALPESPYLTHFYRAPDIARFQELASQLKACAKVVVLDDYRAYGLGNRHFINRQLLADFPYAALSAPEFKFPLPTAIEMGNQFDVDHLNLVGAKRFTEIALKRFFPE